MATAEEHKERLRQTAREKTMTWEEIRDEYIGKIKDVYISVRSGFVQKEVQAERYTICEKCDLFKPLLRQCGSCKCFMPAKTLFNKSICPKGYWKK